MKKSDITKKVKNELKFTNKEYSDLTQKIFNDITEALIRGEKVKIRGFGTFKIKINKAKNGVNPKTREKIRIPSRRAIKFSVSKPLKEKVANRYSEKTIKILD